MCTILFSQRSLLHVVSFVRFAYVLPFLDPNCEVCCCCSLSQHCVSLSTLMTVDTGRRFFPNCSEVLDRLLEDDKLDSLMLESGTPEEQRSKKMRYTELKDEVMEAFKKDKAEKNWAGFSTSSSSSCSPKTNVSHKNRKK